MQAGALGRPVVWRSLNAVRGGRQPWYLQKGRGDGPLLDAAIHNYDFARFTFGEARAVLSSTKTFRGDATCADTGTAIIPFDSGDDLIVSWSWGLSRGRARGSAVNEIIGPQGALYFGRDARPDFASLPRWGRSRGPWSSTGVGAGWSSTRTSKTTCTWTRSAPSWARFGEGARRPWTVREALKSLAIARAVLDSGKADRPFHF